MQLLGNSPGNIPRTRSKLEKQMKCQVGGWGDLDKRIAQRGFEFRVQDVSILILEEEGKS